MKLTDKRDISGILESAGFTFKKSLGQNFLIDSTICPKMASAAADENTGVIEIGPGAGVLTHELSLVAKRVVAIEIDERLKPVLEKTLGNHKNVKVIFADVLKTDLNKIISEEFSDCDTVNICANLPYYITSPIIMSLLQSRLNIGSITVMVQKEAAERICAEVGSRAAGAVTAAVRFYSNAETLFPVSKECFLPSPKVDSAVIKLTVLKEPPVKVKNEEFFFKIVKGCFAQRRKTLLNTLSNTAGIEKSVLKETVLNMNLSESVRGETLTLPQLAELSNRLFEMQK